MIVDTVEDISKPRLRVQPAHLRRLDQGHGPGEGFPAAVGASEEPVAAANADRAHGALGRVVIDPDATILEEQFE